jgi:flagellar protein FlgJ
MDIGKISGSSTENFTNNAASSAVQASDDSFAKKLEAAVQSNDDKELKEACQEFEGIMLNMMYKSMKATITKSDLIEKDAGTEIFESMQDENLMEQASKTGSFGLAESLYKQLSRHNGNGEMNVSRKTVQKSEPVSEKSGK